MSPNSTWGRELKYHRFHIDEAELNRMRHIVDDVADEALKSSESKDLDVIVDMLLRSSETSQSDKVYALACNACSIPAWVNYDKVARGQFVFMKHLTSAAMGLLYFSLIGSIQQK